MRKRKPVAPASEADFGAVFAASSLGGDAARGVQSRIDADRARGVADRGRHPADAEAGAAPDAAPGSDAKRRDLRGRERGSRSRTVGWSRTLVPAGGAAAVSNAPRLLRMIAIAVVCGLVTFLVTTATAQPSTWELSLAFFIGGAALLVQQMIHFDNVLTSFEAHRPVPRIGKTSLPHEAVLDLVRATTAMRPNEPDLMYAFAEAEVVRVTGLLRGLSTGDAGMVGEDHEWISTLARVTKRSIDATSTSTHDGFWGGHAGHRFLTAQHEALRRGVQVRRVFLLDGTEDVDMLRHHLREQERNGVEVRFAVVSDLPKATREGALSDFIVFDGEVSYEFTPELAAEPEAVDVTRVVWRDDQVRTRIELFRELWAGARLP